jgi:2-phosphosulfolactate phosphatase
MGQGPGRVNRLARPIRIWMDLGASGAGRGAARGDVVVIVDALRASVTITAGLQACASRVLPVLTMQEATAYLADPGCRVAGERGGARVPGFHYGNSPTEILAHRAEVRGQVLVLTTSNGTRCVNAALDGAVALLAGSTVNASAVASAAVALARQHGSDVTLVAAGLGDQPSDEDTYAQRLLAARLRVLGATAQAPILAVDETESLRVYLDGEAAARLSRLGYDADVRFCSQIDIWDTVPVYCRDGFYPLRNSARGTCR